jgi:hypothetical protein
VSPAKSFSCSGWRSACEIELIAADTAASTAVVARVSRALEADMAASTVERMIKDRPHRPDLIYLNQPLYFVTFATRDCKRMPSLDVAQAALEQYGPCAKGKFNVAVSGCRGA